MPSSSSQRPGSTILRQEGGKTVLEFVPPKFEVQASKVAKDYIKKKKEGSDFRMNQAIRLQTGVDKIESESFTEAVENRVLERLKEVQEQAYQEAYQLGLKDGEKRAFRENSEAILSRLYDFDKLIATFENMKTLLIQQNESQLISLLFHMASRLAFAEITAEPGKIIEVVRSAVEMVQLDDKITVKVSPTDFAYIERMRKENLKPDEVLQRIKIESDDSIALGGCLVETNYGSVDARFEERVKLLWATISEQLYRVKEKIRAA